MEDDGLRILILPKEPYPLERIRLKELFIKYMAEKGSRLTWVVYSKEKQSDRKRELMDGNNRFLVTRSEGTGSRISIFRNRIHRIRNRKIVKELIRENSYDLILANDGVIEGLIGCRLAGKNGIPFAFYLSSLFFDIERQQFRSEKSIITFVRYVENMLKVPFYNHLIGKSDMFHPISRWMGEYYRDRKKDDVFPLPLCSSDIFLDRNISIDPHSSTLIYIGHIVEMRKIEFLYDIMEIVKESIPNARLVIVGRIFNKKYREYLDEYGAKKGLGGSIEIIEYVPRERIPRLLEDSVIGLSVLPPILAYEVSSPTKVVEYLSVGLPVVANNEIRDQEYIISE
ncbi:MAG: glycosyltransferase, partial [Thermoplasmatota archaeon]